MIWIWDMLSRCRKTKLLFWKCLFLLCSASLLLRRGKKHRPNLASTLGIEEEIEASPDATPLLLHPHDRELPRIYGHRGSFYQEPENTMRSFRRALEGGVNIELDVFLLKDGNLVVFHGDGGDVLPGGLMGYFGVFGSILNLTAEEAMALEFTPGGTMACPDDRLKGARIPFLEEVLQLVKDYEDAEVKIELKGPGTELPVLEMVERMDMVDRCSFISFHHERMRKVRELRPQRNPDGSHVYRTGLLYARLPSDFVQPAINADADEVQLRYDQCKRERVEAIHNAGFASVCWFRGAPAMRRDMRKWGDVDDEDERVYDMVLRSGVRAVTVNRPERMVRLISDIHVHLLELGEARKNESVPPDGNPRVSPPGRR